MARATQKPETATTAKVGETLTLAGPAGLMRLPDGTVVSVRTHYTVRNTGEHVFTPNGGEAAVYMVEETDQ